MGNYKETKSFYLVKKMSTKHKELLYKAIEDNDFVCLAKIANVLSSSSLQTSSIIMSLQGSHWTKFSMMKNML